MLTGTQLRMARAALRLRIDDVADRTGLAWARLQQWERQDGPLSGDPAALDTLAAFFAALGVAFLAETAEHLPGIALRHPDQPESPR